ncbi:MAG TPA: hypothetical protein VI483_03635 [Candidatus Paceibacterota bacterium]
MDDTGRLLFAAVAIVLEFVGIFPYFRDIFRGTTRPHVFTWFSWGVINTVVAVAQFTSGGGAGTAVTAVVALSCFSITLLAARQGNKDITRSDWVCLIGSLLAIGSWTITRDALTAVIIVTVADMIAMIPTVRKTYKRPTEETLSAWIISVFRNIFAILALQSFAVVNWLYPASLIISDAAFVILLIVRRRQLDKSGIIV